ncbi:GDSL-type esterase/lipase family protein [Roseovarius salis]|uniref:SGNH/GDSL hydrolase family protein n=1 Tax=Roseovarius salis TaxID=3376063 RepID=UPI0037C6DB52
MFIARLFKLAAAALLLAGCGESVSRDFPSRILVVGDSMLASHRMSDLAVADHMEDTLSEPVVDRSVIGARYFHPLPISGSAGLNIAKQYVPGDWDWVVVNGGGNDLWLGCGCMACDGRLDRLISEDGRKGRIPGFLSKLRQSGAQVVYVGYLRSPGSGSLIEHCRDEGAELERRVARLAGLDAGVHYLSLQDLVPHGDRSFHAVDMIHPSVKGSNAIARRVADLIRSRQIGSR